jgi:hypothetical protein
MASAENTWTVWGEILQIFLVKNAPVLFGNKSFVFQHSSESTLFSRHVCKKVDNVISGDHREILQIEKNLGSNPTTIPQFLVSAFVSCLLFMLYVRVVRAVQNWMRQNSSTNLVGEGGGGEVWKTPECTLDIPPCIIVRSWRLKHIFSLTFLYLYTD